MPSVMIAEDDLFMADMLEEALAANGYDVCGIARTVEKAVELAEHYKPDLAVLDIRLADGGLGTDIPARLKNQGNMGAGAPRPDRGRFLGPRWADVADNGRWRRTYRQAVPL